MLGVPKLHVVERLVGIKPTKRLRGEGWDHHAAVPPSQTKQTKREKSNFFSAVSQPASHTYPHPIHLQRMKKVMSFEERGPEKKGMEGARTGEGW